MTQDNTQIVRQFCETNLRVKFIESLLESSRKRSKCPHTYYSLRRWITEKTGGIESAVLGSLSEDVRGSKNEGMRVFDIPCLQG